MANFIISFIYFSWICWKYNMWESVFHSIKIELFTHTHRDREFGMVLVVHIEIVSIAARELGSRHCIDTFPSSKYILRWYIVSRRISVVLGGYLYCRDRLICLGCSSFCDIADEHIVSFFWEIILIVIVIVDGMYGRVFPIYDASWDILSEKMFPSFHDDCSFIFRIFYRDVVSWYLEGSVWICLHRNKIVNHRI